MKVLVVCSINAGRIPTFILEQVDSLDQKGIETEYFLIKGKGLYGYLANITPLNIRIKSYKPDLVHAHYGLSGLLANFQRKVPVITTFHGSDINDGRVRPLSNLAIKLSIHSVFVSEKLACLMRVKDDYSVISCGINLDTFKPVPKMEARKLLGFDLYEKIVLFSGSFSNKVKNYLLARDAIQQLDRPVKLIELTGYSREEVNLLLNACDVALLTSFTEGSPNFIKEAMACNCPIVSVDVGDVKEITANTKGTFICRHSAGDVAKKLAKALNTDSRTDGRSQILHLDLQNAAVQLVGLYEKIVHELHQKKKTTNC